MARAKNQIEVYIAVITLKDVCLGLQCTDDFLDLCQLFRRYLSNLVDNDGVAELNLLDDQTFQIIFPNILFQQILSTAKLIPQAQSIDRRHDGIELSNAVLGKLWVQFGVSTDGLCDGSWLTNATRLDDNVVEFVHAHDVVELLYQVEFQGTADATILQGHQTIILLSNHPTLFNEAGIDVHLTDVVNNDGKLDAFRVG